MKAILSLAANSPDREAQLARALASLQQLDPQARCSTLYDTVAVGCVPQPNYLNGVVQLETTLDLSTLKAHLKGLEAAAGRTPQSKAAGCIPLDIDVVVYNNELLRPKDWAEEYMQLGVRELGLELVY